MKADRIIFGLTAVALGVVWLLVNLGVIHPSAARELWRYWPLLIIIWGLLIVFGKGSGLPGCLVGIILFALLFGAFFAPFSFRGGVYPTSESETAISIEDATRMRVELVHSAGELTLRAETNQDNLFRGRFKANNEPRVSHNTSDGLAEITVRDEISSTRWEGPLSNWQIFLAKQIPAEITLRTGATQAELNLADLQVEELTIKAGAGELVLHLGRTDTRIQIESGAGKVTIYVPEETGVRLRASGGLLTVNGEKAGVVKVSERNYESRNIDKKTAVAEVSVTAGAGTVELLKAR